MATPTRPLVLPDAYSGEGSWSQWYFHFQNVVAVNGWDEGTQLKWLKVRLTGRAQTAFQRLPTETQQDLGQTVTALKERFEPASQKTRYQAELQTRRKKKSESWADLAEDLRLLADKAYPDLADNARERLALNAYLGQLDNPQVAFGVKQKTPENLDAAIAATLELESYLPPRATVAAMTESGPEELTTLTPVGAVSANTRCNEQLANLMEKLLDRVEKLEMASRPRQRRPGGGVVCWNCGEPGHIRKFCRAPKREDQGNS